MSTATTTDIDDHVADLERDGITARRAAFAPDWVDRLHADVLAAFADARTRERGVIDRGPQRWYAEVNPEQLSGFVDLVTHPFVTTLCEAVLGPDYEIVEIGFDIPFAGAADQPWHRDFPSPVDTHVHRRLTSLAFNITTVDTTADMGPFQIAPGTQYESGADWDHRMFPPRAEWDRFASVSQLRMPQRGDISARSALTVHRGTANRSPHPRPVVVLGADAPGASQPGLHDMAVTESFWQSLASGTRRHLAPRVVSRLEPVVQRHDIEGLVMGAP